MIRKIVNGITTTVHDDGRIETEYFTQDEAESCLYNFKQNDARIRPWSRIYEVEPGCWNIMIFWDHTYNHDGTPSLSPNIALWRYSGWWRQQALIPNWEIVYEHKFYNPNTYLDNVRQYDIPEPHRWRAG